MLTKEDLIQVLERSEDWYIVVSVKDNQAIVEYSNKEMKRNCPGHCAVHAFEDQNNLFSCAAFKKLVPTILAVSKTKQKVHIPEYKFNCIHAENFKFVDLQIYANNGHVVICARDLSPIVYNLRTSIALLNSKYDTLLSGKNR